MARTKLACRGRKMTHTKRGRKHGILWQKIAVVRLACNSAAVDKSAIFYIANPSAQAVTILRKTTSLGKIVLVRAVPGKAVNPVIDAPVQETIKAELSKALKGAFKDTTFTPQRFPMYGV